MPKFGKMSAILSQYESWLHLTRVHIQIKMCGAYVPTLKNMNNDKTSLKKNFKLMWLLYYETQQSYVATNIALVINIETY